MERAALFGESEGGPSAAMFAATCPERVRALVLYGTFPGRLTAEVTDTEREIAASYGVTPELMARKDREFDEAIENLGQGRLVDLFMRTPRDTSTSARSPRACRPLPWCCIA